MKENRNRAATGTERVNLANRVSNLLGRLGIWAILTVSGTIALPQAVKAGDIQGRVLDANTGSYLRGASVKISKLTRRTTTDRGGAFSFTNVAAGTYTLEVDFITYDRVRETVQVPATGMVTRTLSVGEEKIELEEYLVEGLREGRSLALQQKRTAANIRDILSADSIGNLPDANVAEALVRLPGVALDLDQGEGRFVSIRGVEPNLNNVTINGASVANPGVDGRQGRSMPLDVIGSSQVSQLEVIKSVTPDMDAQGLGGTVNIITASGFDKEKPFAYGKLEGGYNTMSDDLLYAVQATYGTTFGPEKEFGMAVSASYEWRPYRTEHVAVRWTVEEDSLSGNDLLAPRDLEIVPADATVSTASSNTGPIRIPSFT